MRRNRIISLMLCVCLPTLMHSFEWKGAKQKIKEKVERTIEELLPNKIPAIHASIYGFISHAPNAKVFIYNLDQISWQPAKGHSDGLLNVQAGKTKMQRIAPMLSLAGQGSFFFKSLRENLTPEVLNKFMTFTKTLPKFKKISAAIPKGTIPIVQTFLNTPYMLSMPLRIRVENPEPDIYTVTQQGNKLHVKSTKTGKDVQEVVVPIDGKLIGTQLDWALSEAISPRKLKSMKQHPLEAAAVDKYILVIEKDGKLAVKNIFDLMDVSESKLAAIAAKLDDRSKAIFFGMRIISSYIKIWRESAALVS